MLAENDSLMANLDALMKEFDEVDTVVASGALSELSSSDDKKRKAERIDTLLAADRATIKKPSRSLLVSTCQNDNLIDSLIHELIPYARAITHPVPEAHTVIGDLNLRKGVRMESLICIYIEDAVLCAEPGAQDEAIHKLQWLVWAFASSEQRRIELRRMLVGAAPGMPLDVKKILQPRKILGYKFGSTVEHTRTAASIVRAMLRLFHNDFVCPTIYRPNTGYAYPTLEYCINGWNAL